MADQFAEYSGYATKCEKDEPRLVPQEEVYLRLQSQAITLEDSTKGNGKIKGGNALVTTHRVLFYLGDECLEIPLCYVQNLEKGSKGLFGLGNDYVIFKLHRLDETPPYIVDLYTNIHRRSDAIPEPPKLPTEITFRFHDKTRNKFYEMLEEALQSKRWNEKIVTASQKEKMGLAIGSAASGKSSNQMMGGIAAF